MSYCLFLLIIQKLTWKVFSTLFLDFIGTVCTIAYIITIFLVKLYGLNEIKIIHQLTIKYENDLVMQCSDWYTLHLCHHLIFSIVIFSRVCGLHNWINIASICINTDFPKLAVTCKNKCTRPLRSKRTSDNMIKRVFNIRETLFGDWIKCRRHTIIYWIKALSNVKRNDRYTIVLYWQSKN